MNYDGDIESGALHLHSDKENGAYLCATYKSNQLHLSPRGGFNMASMNDAELERMLAEAEKVMIAGGMEYDPVELRKTLSDRLAEVRGTPKVEEEVEDTGPKVDLKASAKKLEVNKVVAALASDQAYWYEKPEDEKFMAHFINLRQKGGVVGNLLLTGPSGSGKTEGLRRLAEKAGLPFYKMDCATITTEDKWIGHKEIDHEGTKFVLSEHLKWLEGKDHEPGIVCYDELTRVHPSRLNVVLPILDGSQAIFVPDLGDYVKVHPQTIIVATANIGTAFGGTYVMDRALRERFNFTLERTFPPVDEEVKVLSTSTGIEADKAKVLVDIANQTRKKWELDELESPISTRTLKAASMLVASGMSIISAMEYTALPLYKSDGGTASERHMVMLIMTGKSK